VLNQWEARHTSADQSADVDLSEYNAGRHSTLSKTWDGSGAPATSLWSDGNRAGVLAYGEPLIPDHPIPNRPSNPEVLDDPNYDRVSDGPRR
jgi:hypothetical protein